MFFYGVMLDKVEVDLNKLLNGPWFVALCSDTEMILIKTITTNSYVRGSDHIRKGAEQFRLDIYLLGTGWKVVCL